MFLDSASRFFAADSSLRPSCVEMNGSAPETMTSKELSVTKEACQRSLTHSVHCFEFVTVSPNIYELSPKASSSLPWLRKPCVRRHRIAADEIRARASGPLEQTNGTL